MGWKTELAYDLGSFMAAEKLLYTASTSARKGWRAPIPFLGDKVFGRRIGGWGGVRTFAERRALGIYERGGLFGMEAARKTAAGKFGKSVASRVGAKYLVGRVAGLAIPIVNWYLAADLAVSGVSMAYQGVTAAVNQYKGLELGGDFYDTQGAYTSRQRALRAITSSNLQARSAIGNEAMLMHR